MVTHTHLPLQSAQTQQWTHTLWTHMPEQWAAIYAAAPGEQLGVRCLAQGHLSRGIGVDDWVGGWVLDIHSPDLQFLPAQNSNSQPFDYETNFPLPLVHDFRNWRWMQIRENSLLWPAEQTLFTMCEILDQNPKYWIGRGFICFFVFCFISI